MMSAARTPSPRRGRRSAEQIIVGALIVLGVVASIFLVLSESVQLLRVGLVAALWAAIVGAIAMTKYRREAAVDKAKARDLKKVYELQLEREISARREYELGVEARVRREVRADAEELAGLRAELVALRANLQILFDGQLPVERVALRADSTRVGELSGGTGAAPPEPVYHDSAVRPQFASPYDEPVTAETSIVVDPIPMPKAPEPVTEQIPAVRDDTPAPVARTEPATEPQPEPEPELPEPRRRRRAAPDTDEADGGHSKGVSVAQLLAQLKEESEAQAGSGRGK